MNNYVRRNHLALIALAVAVIGVPTAWAVGRNTIGSAQIKPKAVKTSDLSDDAVTSEKVDDGSLQGRDFAPGELPAGEPGPQGDRGPQGEPGPTGPAGAPGSVPAGPSPAEPVAVQVGDGSGAVNLASVTFTGSGQHRLLLTGGFNVNCNPCNATLSPSWRLDRTGGGGTPLALRRMSPITAAQITDGASVSEVIVTPSVCAPCTYNLALEIPAAGANNNVLDATNIRLGVVDLGPLA